MIIAAWLSIGLTFGMALLQLLLVFGAPLGEYVLGGKHEVLPPKMRLLSVLYTCVFIIVGLSFLQAVEIIAPVFGAAFMKVTLIIYTLFLAYAVIGNGFLTKSKKEKYVMTPISIIGCTASIVLLPNVL